MSAATSVLDAIGNTPMIELRRVVPSGSARVMAKLEWSNPTGSMKDRMAKAVVEAAEADGRLTSGGTVVEYTAGTTGISLALVCAAKGYGLHIVFSDAFSEEKRRTMLAFAATITDAPSHQKQITEALIKEMIETSRRISERPGHWWAHQLNNHDAIKGYYPLGEEIWHQTGGDIDAFVHAVGTAHSIHGVGKVLTQRKPAVQVVAVEPAESAVLSGRPTRAHRDVHPRPVASVALTVAGARVYYPQRTLPVPRLSVSAAGTASRIDMSPPQRRIPCAERRVTCAIKSRQRTPGPCAAADRLVRMWATDPACVRAGAPC